MVRLAMVALAVVLHRELPIAVLAEIFLLAYFAITYAMRKDVRFHFAAHLLEVRGRFIGEADKDEPGDVSHVNHLQAEFASVEIIAHMLGMDEVSLQVIGPLVIGTDHIPDTTLIAIAK